MIVSSTIYADFMIQEVYNDLCDEMVKLKKINKELQNKVISIENERNKLSEALNINVEIEISCMKAQNDTLKNQLENFKIVNKNP